MDQSQMWMCPLFPASPVHCRSWDTNFATNHFGTWSCVIIHEKESKEMQKSMQQLSASAECLRLAPMHYRTWCKRLNRGYLQNSHQVCLSNDSNEPATTLASRPKAPCLCNHVFIVKTWGGLISVPVIHHTGTHTNTCIFSRAYYDFRILTSTSHNQTHHQHITLSSFPSFLFFLQDHPGFQPSS